MANIPTAPSPPSTEARGGEWLGSYQRRQRDLGHPHDPCRLLLAERLEEGSKQRARGDEGSDVLHLVVLELQCADPQQVHHQCGAQSRGSDRLKRLGRVVLCFHVRVLASACFYIYICRYRFGASVVVRDAARGAAPLCTPARYRACPPARRPKADAKARNRQGGDQLVGRHAPPEGDRRSVGWRAAPRHQERASSDRWPATWSVGPARHHGYSTRTGTRCTPLHA